MADIIGLAEAVARDLATYRAEVSFSPDYDLKEIDSAKVVVVPTGIEYKTLGRGIREELFKISIGILKRVTEAELVDMTNFATDIGVSFLNRRLAEAACVSVAHEPLYSPDHLRERHQFTSVLALTFKAVCHEDANRL